MGKGAYIWSVENNIKTMANTDSLYIENLGPIQSAQVDFGDLTILVGPQASGKTIFAELFKLIKDKDYILHSIEDTYKISVADTLEDSTLDKYFGNGMHSIWNNQTIVSFNGKLFDTSELYSYKEELSNLFSIYYIPARRSSEFDEGRLKEAYEVRESPYVLREFRDLLDGFLYSLQLAADNSLLYFNHFDAKIFGQGKIGMQKKSKSDPWRLVQEYKGSIIDYMAWSTGQSEYAPLRIGLEDVSVNPIYDYVVIEEPEIGLHPKAIADFVKEIIKLTNKTKVIVITHSSILLEFIWAIKSIDRTKVPTQDISKELFKTDEQLPLNDIFDKTINTYAFVKDVDESVDVKNISNLDAWSKEDYEAKWGGLTDFATITSDFVSKYYKEDNDGHF